MLARGLSGALLAGGAILPAGAVRRICENGGTLFYVLPAIRRALLENARHILGSTSTAAARRALALAVLRNFGRAIADLVSARRRFRSESDLPLEVRGRENFEAAASHGKGLIAVSLHMGSYEVGSMVIARRSPSAAIVYHRDPAPFFERMRSAQRQRARLDEVPIDASPFFGIELLRRLREGGSILIAGELAAGPRGEPFPFLHGEAAFSTWPARLALETGAAILPAFTVRRGDGELRLSIEEPLLPRREDTPRALMARLVEIFERYVRDYPEQWLMVRPFWL